MPITPEAFRDALRHFPAGVTIVTIKAGEQVHGLTVSAFASVSPEPPLVLVCIDHRHRAHELLQASGASFAINILREDQRSLSDRFAYVQHEDRFAVGDWGAARTGAPVLRDALAWLDCTVYGHQPAGTHTIYVGIVQASQVPTQGEPPLIYWNRDYRRLAGNG